ncbi:hypothetical protein [Flavobacterium sp.]|uniref:hypothetical protein n=1 Tax=Flavobacterium sp. TaxID=239 RepID=UPI0026198674|nr:hypothetical protein [Flavobacterium sp.]MDD3005047.1 hypothetical protein [Flavobacterium sp.]
MRQLIAIGLLFLYVFTSTEINELLKFPLLVQHFKEHQQAKGSLTFSQFVHEHYANGDIDDTDRDQDLKLPYKSIDFSNSLFFTVLPNVISINLASTPDFYVLKSPVNFYRIVFLSHNFNNIWQPPKIV